ncbi:hypothetical protein QOZ80_8AG0616740 [Eleusine coracana subsp. coracana]|nr:hypothetical protein QOZ80_8AG0616740 [Eleusine coracana subsp. coracana]
MRLLSFVPCGNRAGPIDDAPPAAADLAADRRRRRRRTAGAAAAADDQWRPALGDICELGEYGAADAANKARRGSKVAPARIGKSSSWDVARVLPRAHSDEYRHLESASSMRPLAPTAFLF